MYYDMTDKEIELFVDALVRPDHSIYGFTKEEKQAIMNWLRGDSRFERIAHGTEKFVDDQQQGS